MASSHRHYRSHPPGTAAKDGPLDRRQFGRLAIGSLVAAATAGCSTNTASSGRLEKVWGRLGISDGRFQKPRAMAIDDQDRLYIVDMTARIQVFDSEGTFLRAWNTPEHANGKPTGLTIAPDGILLVADTHYYRVLSYTQDGQLLTELTLGGTMGQGPGEFGFVTCAVRDAAGNYYVAEYGEYDRIQKFSPDREFVLQWGGHGAEPGQFARPQNLEIDADGHIWVADACSHRIQVFDTDGKLLATWGTHGSDPGQLRYPYDLAFDGEGHVYICEYGNHRVQKFTLDGRTCGCWGTSGRRPGQLFNPWALVVDSHGRLHVLDSNNHRVQRIVM
jgi:DNA-binding beta-propeller fold protein YncE